MNNTVRDSELIQGYIDRTLTDSEKHEVEYRLKEEAGLQALHLETTRLVAGIRFSHLENKLEQLRALEAVLPNLKSGKGEEKGRQYYFIPLSIAASITVILGIWFFAFRDSRPLHERLYAQSFEAFDSPGSGLTRSENAPEQSLKSRAYEAYDRGDYPKAIELFTKTLKQSDDAIAHLCLGNAYLASGNVQKAEETFYHMTKQHEDLITQAKWYLALTYLKTEQDGKDEIYLMGNQQKQHVWR